MTSQDKARFSVVGGPSKFDLMLSLFDGNQTPRRTVDFQLEGKKYPISVAILGVQQEDGSGESWNIEGLLWDKHHSEGYKVKGYYVTKGRAGSLVFEAPYCMAWNQEKNEFIRQESDTEVLKFNDFMDKLRRC